MASILKGITDSVARIFGESASKHVVEATPYTYERLEKSEIRLLKLFSGERDDELHCELKSTSLRKGPKYLAVSYAWGNSVQDHRILLKTGHNTWSELTVTSNLRNALVRLRDPSQYRYIWVDQVCIAQNNNIEKSQQVQQMNSIYARAEKTVVWLGDDDSDMPLIRQMSDRLTLSPPETREVTKMHQMDQDRVWDLIKLSESEDGQAQDRREAVVRFLGGAWFKRAWVYQEAIVAADVEVYCGEYRVSFDILARMVLTIYYITKIEQDGIWCKKIKKSKGFGPLRAIWYDREQYHKSKSGKTKGDKTKQVAPLDFLHILWRARKYLEASRPEDMVYSFLAFDDLSADHKIQADYTKSPQEAYKVLTISMIKSRKSLDILQSVVPTKPSKSHGPIEMPLPHLPSWVADWSNRRFTSGSPILCPGVTHKFDACRGEQHEWVGSEPLNSNVLLVKGHVIDSIYTIIDHKCEENTYFKSSLKQCLRLDDFIDRLEDELETAAEELDGSSRANQEHISSSYSSQSQPTVKALDSWNMKGDSSASDSHKQNRDPKIYPRRKYKDIPALALRTLLADGSFGHTQPIEQQFSAGPSRLENCISELLRVYATEGNEFLDPKTDVDSMLYRYIRDTASIAEEKFPFLTHHLDVGLGYSNFRKGDLLVVLYGSKAPCMLRRKSHGSREYRFMGQCYVDGWMYGGNLRNYKWWEREPTTFALC